MNLTIKQAYDITSAILSNKYIGIQNTSDDDKTSYRVESTNPLYGNLILDIEAPHGSPDWESSVTLCIGHEGSIHLRHNNQNVFNAYTNHNIGYTFNRKKYNPISIITRMRARRFFKILNMADARLNGKLKTHDNNQQIHNIIKDINAKTK